MANQSSNRQDQSPNCGEGIVPQTPAPQAESQKPASGAKKIILIILAIVGAIGLAGVLACAGLFLFFVKPQVEAAKDAVSKNNLRVIGLSLHNYHDTFKTLPYSTISDREGKPYRSWRVTALLFTDYRPDYERFDHKRPWNDPVNQAAADRLPDTIFHSPLDPGPVRNTSYVAITGPHAAFLATVDLPADENEQQHGQSDEGSFKDRMLQMERMMKGGYKQQDRAPEDAVVSRMLEMMKSMNDNNSEPRLEPTFSRIRDGLRNTIMVIEVENSGIPWNQPGDMTIDQAIAAIKNSSRPYTNCLFGDGAVRQVSRNTTEETLRKLLTIDDGKFPPSPSEWEK